MPKVSLHYGITIPGPKEYSSVRVDVGLELDADGDVDVQLKKCLDAAKKAEEPLEGALVQQAADVEGVALEGTGLATELEEFRQRMERRTDNIIEEVQRHRDKLEALDASGLIKDKKAKAPKAKAKVKAETKPAPAEEEPKK